jgi:hypothetical protein
MQVASTIRGRGAALARDGTDSAMARSHAAGSAWLMPHLRRFSEPAARRSALLLVLAAHYRFFNIQ